jgi:hypothetical protein
MVNDVQRSRDPVPTPLIVENPELDPVSDRAELEVVPAWQPLSTLMLVIFLVPKVPMNSDHSFSSAGELPPSSL